MAIDKSDKLKKDYESKQASAKKFRNVLVEQIQKLLTRNKIDLAVPLERRVKKWSSIKKNIDESSLELEDILQLDDFVGIRLILPFKRDIDKCSGLIEKNLEVIDKKDTSSRLEESQFGYQSYHYIIKLPKQWLPTPTLEDFAEWKAEIQVRTMAQHTWAAASHILQYKQKDDVPESVRRSIYRVSALLETVDLEFERVLDEREEYTEEVEPDIQNEKLNVDLLKKILDAHLPIENRIDDERYSESIEDLSKYGIEKSSELISLINEQLAKALEYDARKVEFITKNSEEDVYKGIYDKYEIDRASRGFFYNHTDLIQVMLVAKENR